MFDDKYVFDDRQFYSIFFPTVLGHCTLYSSQQHLDIVTNYDAPMIDMYAKFNFELVSCIHLVSK
jgi:hypothetical protein